MRVCLLFGRVPVLLEGNRLANGSISELNGLVIVFIQKFES